MNDDVLYYISSNGDQLLPGELHLARFSNALRLIEREGRANPNHANLARLKAVFAQRQAEWEAANPK